MGGSNNATLATPPPMAANAVREASWLEEMKCAYRDAAALGAALGLSETWVSEAQAAARAQNFPLFAPRPYVARMAQGHPADPLLRQVLPLADEQRCVDGFELDPVADLAAQTVPGVIRKYAGRALLITTGACAVHCRYCFRRHFPYSAAPHTLADWQPVLAQLALDPQLQEIILSGGDPWTLRDEVLEQLTQSLAAQLPHLRRLRIHTRLPIVIPQRVTEALLAHVSALPGTKSIVLHVNHPQEIDGRVAQAIQHLRSTGALLLNQAVLLRGVNDDAEVLVELSERLLDVGVLPYYLHQLDRVAGAAHFEVPRTTGQRLFQEMQRRLPGYAVPRWVCDEPGFDSKQWLA